MSHPAKPGIDCRLANNEMVAVVLSYQVQRYFLPSSRQLIQHCQSSLCVCMSLVDSPFPGHASFTCSYLPCPQAHVCPMWKFNLEKWIFPFYLSKQSQSAFSDMSTRIDPSSELFWCLLLFGICCLLTYVFSLQLHSKHLMTGSIFLKHLY